MSRIFLWLGLLVNIGSLLFNSHVYAQTNSWIAVAAGLTSAAMIGLIQYTLVYKKD